MKASFEGNETAGCYAKRAARQAGGAQSFDAKINRVIPLA
jgi:hypothetical protein